MYNRSVRREDETDQAIPHQDVSVASRHTANGPSPASIAPSSRLDSEDGATTQFQQYEQPRKRQRADTASATFVYPPRKRAVTACQTCRARKTKCNNARPACALCVRNNTECLYDDFERSENPPGLNPPGDVVLDHLKQILSRLDKSVIPLLATKRIPHSNIVHAEAVSPSLPDNDGVCNLSSDLPEDHYLTIPSSRTSPDSTLQWPIFENKYPPKHVINTLFRGYDEREDSGSHRSGRADLGTIRSRGARMGDIEESRILELVNRYLELVHTKNPIIDAPLIKQYARIMMEEGPGWNDKSCLVLLACALGSVAKPYHLGPITPNSELVSDSIEDSSAEMQAAESYYTLARRRIGLLKDSIITTQCYFLSAVYLMYTFRPLDAWRNFHQASMTFYLCSKIREAEDYSTFERARHIEQRLYWSCFKSECELRVQMSLPASEITNLHFPDLFPSPPRISSPSSDEPRLGQSPANWNHDTPNSHTSSLRSAPAQDPKEQEKSWFYYLTEIAFRRIGNRILNIFHRDEHPICSSMAIPDMIKMTTDFEGELDQWYWGLPDIIRWDNNDLYIIPAQELTYLVGMRLLEIKLWLYRPFVFYAIHSFVEDPHLHLTQPLVEKALFNCSRFVEATAIKHRHQGTWMVLHAATMAALTIIAAVKSRRLDMPEGWRQTVQQQISTLKYWERESHDMQRSRILLEDMLDNLDKSV